MGVAQTPLIGVEMDFDTEEYFLTATSYSRTMPAGERLFRCRPEHYPDVEFRHAALAQAQEHAARLQTYVNAPHKAGKARGREEDEREAVVESGGDPLEGAWWRK